MPLSTVIPPQSIEWIERLECPSQTQDPDSFVGDPIIQLAFARIAQLRPPSAQLLPSNAPAAESIRNYGSLSTFSVRQYAVVNGRKCFQAAVSGDTWCDGFRFASWLPSFGPASGFNPGATYWDGSVVGVFDFHLAINLVAATPGWADDSTGTFFLPVASGVDGQDTPAFAAGIGGFGVFCNNDGAGGARYEYVSWRTGGPATVLERVAIGTGIVPDISNWNTFRYVIVGAASGREATVEVIVNGQTIVTREFGSSVLDRPGTSVAGALGMFAMLSVNGPDSDEVAYLMDAKCGRFTPAGAELQGN